MSGVYDGLTVVELADRRNQWAGKLLADGGARVIQIEPPGGSPGRWCGPFVDDRVERDALLAGVVPPVVEAAVGIDIGRQPAQDLLRRLLSRADIFLESTPPGTLRACDLDYGAGSSHRSPNTSRATIIAEGTLAAALARGRPGFAAVDVFETEPVVGAAHPLLAMDNALCTPHLGYAEREGYEGIYGGGVKRLLAWAAGKPIDVVNPEALERGRM